MHACSRASSAKSARVASMDGRPADDRRARNRAGGQLGDSIAIDGVCLTVVAADGNARFRRGAARRSRARRSEPSTRGRGSTWSRRSAPATRSAATTSRATSTASARCAASSPRARAGAFGSTRPPSFCSYIVEKGSIAVQGTSLTVAAVDDAGFAVALIPHTLQETTLGELAPERPREPRGRRAREIRREAPAPLAFTDGRDHTVRHRRRGDRGDPRRPHGRRRRRRGPRERRRPDDRRAVRDARRDQLHGDACARADLPLPHRGARRRARRCAR